MTELYIDNTQVVLPENFSLEIMRENPLITKNGDYTYDLTLSLKNPINKKVYQHLNRINKSSDIPKNRSARLIVDNQNLVNGTEIILEISDEEVKIQLVAGESQLNYFISSNIRMKDLTLGWIQYEEEIPEQPFYSSLPFFNVIGDDVQNGRSVYQDRDGYVWMDLFPGTEVSISPRFSVVLERILTVLGFRIGYNVFRNEELKNLFLFNGYFAQRLDTLIPDWTVVEFLSEVEKLFNVMFLIDSYENRISVKSKNDYYNNDNSTVFILEVFDNFEIKNDDENRDNYSVSNIGYDRQSTDYFKYQDVDPAIMNKINDKNIYRYPDFNSISSMMNSLIIDRTRIKDMLFYAEESDTYYICYEDEGGVFYPKKINAFAPIYNNPLYSDIDIELKIKPASMRVVSIPVHPTYGGAGTTVFYLSTQMPEINHEPIDDYSYTNKIIDIQNVIADGNQEAPRVSDMFVFFYDGLKWINKEGEEGDYTTNQKVEYPVPYVDFLYETNRKKELKINESNLSLRLNHSDGLSKFYFQSVNADTTKEYYFKFINREKIDPKAIFIINNKKFICKSLKYTVDQDGINPLVEGYFYPVLLD